MNLKIREIIAQLSTERISEERKIILQPLIQFISSKLSKNEEVRLNFICTHNSRRSHLSQIWAQTMAYYYQIENVFCYSGGTEATAMFPKVAETLANQGFEILKLSETENPVYAVKFAENEHAVICFSKKYDDNFNPKSEFAAILTCDSADENCPIVYGAEARIPIKYEDPKKSDGIAEMNETYFNRSLEIATEMKFIFENIRKS
ncbi:arsenate-mycothiol transferase ArsC [Cloacibacterium sp. TD35]|uniref:arsenate-mycothiol transferase ArsC n=1 Tax=Cloacibacterium sp. TD35 TaxID=2976818 RepID=UPI00237EE9A1|nr:protein-tyrosine-phosphatase [Cloacibacterium sp. TD35]WDT67365.1 protein-tyrosine-phosphatase [Cloacibacterium sp. TD35]